MSAEHDGGTDPTLTPEQAISEAPTRAGTAPPVGRTAATLPDRYVEGRLLGAGGMGEVVLATDRQLGREVAIKRMRMAATPEAMSRFVREAKIQGRLDHPAIVPVHELANDADGQPFFVMKRLAGATLAEGRARFTRQKLLRAFADVCFAIEFAHSRGIVHRDLKPANIMLGDFGEVYVLDWGIARVLDEADDVAPRSGDADLRSSSTNLGAIIGTPGYIAPEVLAGAPVDRLTDVYALGCILYELLADSPLVPRDHPVLVPAIVDARPSLRVRDVPPELDEICVAATGEHATRPTARAVAERIERFLDGDRDLALRTTLAASHLAAARRALDAGDDEAERAIAMREAGRAIALDPTSGDAADLVGRLMLEPPRAIPREVEERLAAIDDRTAREKVRLISFLLGSYLLFVPIIWWMGLRSVPLLVVFLVATGVNAANTIRYASRPRLTLWAIYVAAILNAVPIAVVAHLFSPFLVAPGIAAASVMSFAVDHRVNWRVITAISSGAVVLPWLAELVGLLPRTMSEVGGALVLDSPLVSVHFPQTEVALALYVVTMVALAALISSRLGAAHHAALCSTELQAWHLRHLVRR